MARENEVEQRRILLSHMKRTPGREYSVAELKEVLSVAETTLRSVIRPLVLEGSVNKREYTKNRSYWSVPVEQDRNAEPRQMPPFRPLDSEYLKKMSRVYDLIREREVK